MANTSSLEHEISSLEHELLRVFKLALGEGRADVGELLLQALEKMGGSIEHTAVRAAYREIGRPDIGAGSIRRRTSATRMKSVS